MNTFEKALDDRNKKHLLRTLPLPPEGIDFYSNDYLGLAHSDSLHRLIDEALQKTPIQNGATGSRLLSGNSAYAEEIEALVAEFHHAEAALIYSSGYMANLGLISSLATKETTLICDELIHASLIDGARLGIATKVRFRHNDLDDLKQKLKDVKGQKVVIVESVYSMDGDICPLEEVATLCEESEALLVVDEAHGFGVYGTSGEGLGQQLGLSDRIFARIVTYGKAAGIHGAAVLGPAWLKDYQINFSRSMIFSTAPTMHHFASIAAMYGYLPQCTSQREALQSNVSYFKHKRESSKGWIDSPSHIQSLIVPGNKHVVEMGRKLHKASINALPIRQPSVPVDAERIRFCLHAYNTPKEIDLLFDLLND